MKELKITKRERDGVVREREREREENNRGRIKEKEETQLLLKNV